VANISNSASVSFLPSSLRTESPQYIVWWTGTLGQAEWLITHAQSLRGNSITMECPKNLSGILERTRPLLALEQPDLVVSTIDGTPLLSIEITEQQEFGSNSHQRVARFWSAVANNVPSAFLMPIESYQLEKASPSLAETYEMKESEHKQFMLFCSQIPRINGKKLWEKGIRSLQFQSADEFADVVGLKGDNRNSTKQFYEKHVLGTSEVDHIKVVPPKEFLHKVGTSIYKAYLRTRGKPTAMVLTWFDTASKFVPTNIFRLQSEYSLLFRTNGIEHTLEDREFPHLSFRNLPPGPEKSRPVNKKLKIDEIKLFFNFVDSAVQGKAENAPGREFFVRADEYFPSESNLKWRSDISRSEEVLTKASGDFQISKELFIKSLELMKCEGRANAVSGLKDLGALHLLALECSVTRGLADPYSGMLAVRDLLFTRNSEDPRTPLTNFDRESGLVLMVNLKGEAAYEHTFLEEELRKTYERLQPKGKASTPKDQLLGLCTNVRIESLPKNIRCHLLFSDLIIVRRHFDNEIESKCFFGIPALIRTGELDLNCEIIQSVTK